MSEAASTASSLVISDENPVIKKLETRMKRYPPDLSAVQELIKQAESRVEALDTHIQDQTSAGNKDAAQALAEKKKIVSANAAGLKRRQGQLLKGINKRPRAAKMTRSTAAQSDSMEVDATPNSVDLTAQSAAPTPTSPTPVLPTPTAPTPAPPTPNVAVTAPAPSTAVPLVEPA
ncbi:hypothetical protein EST38_g12412, partial [Candolleomyces aberdarensis]